MVSIRFTGSTASLQYPQRQLGDDSSPTYYKSDERFSPKYPQRQLGDCSNPTYKGARDCFPKYPQAATVGSLKSGIRWKVGSESSPSFRRRYSKKQDQTWRWAEPEVIPHFRRGY